MPIRVLIYGREGDGGAYAALAQIRTLIRELRVDASVQIITDQAQLKMHGIEDPPAVSVDGSLVSVGYVPARSEMQGYLQQRADALRRPQEEA
jgi:hypothetical protein